MAANATSVLDEYSRRLTQHQEHAARGAARDHSLALAKLLAVFLLLALGWAAFISRLFAPAWLGLPLALLVVLFMAHDRVLADRARAGTLVAWYERGLARVDEGPDSRWSGLGPSGERFRDPDHPYADDLDLFGEGSLFQLLCTASTPMGERRLADWLRCPAPPDTVHARQHQIAAWREALPAREHLAALTAALAPQLDPDRLTAWAASPAVLPASILRWAAAGLTAATIAAAITGAVTGNWTAALLLVFAQLAVLYSMRRRIEAVLASPPANRHGLMLFAGVLAAVPPGIFPQARAPVEPVHLQGPIRRLGGLMDWREAAETLLGRILDFSVLYSLHVAFALDAWRRRYGARVPLALEAVAEYEALQSLAAYAYEHPDDPFPEFLDAAAGPSFIAADLGHPLIAASVCIRNSVQLNPQSRLWIISGSNMSGKSTLLRTVGINVVMAQMGAPVRARSLRLTPLAVGTRLHTADSLRQGRSGFYAEILRLRQILALTRPGAADPPLPLLYLFDELLEGTNSRDRVAGSAGLLGALLDRPTLGLITTHDLALTALASELGPAVRNVHFEDQIEHDKVHFDHRLRDGVITRGNGIALMRAIGLDV